MDLDHYASSNERWKREVFVNVLCEKLMDVIVKQEAKKINNLKREPTCENCFEKGHTSRKCTELMEIIGQEKTEDDELVDSFIMEIHFKDGRKRKQF